MSNYRSPIVIRDTQTLGVAGGPVTYTGERRTRIEINCTAGSIIVHFYDDTDTELPPSLTLNASETWLRNWHLSDFVPVIKITSTGGGTYTYFCERN